MNLVIKNLSKSFKEKNAIDEKIVFSNINFSANGGDCLGVIGPNGCGKTSLMMTISGFYNQKEGSVLFNNQTIEEYTKNNSFPVSFITKKFQVDERQTILDSLLFISKIHHYPKNITLQKIDEILNELNLLDYKKKKINILSEGNKQRFYLAVCLLNDAPIYIFDEPTTALDEQGVVIFKSIVKRLLDNKKIIIISSHEKDFLNDVCNKFYEIKNNE